MRSRIYLSLICICLLFGTIFIGISEFDKVEAIDRYVGPNSTHDTIQDALDNATSGDVIIVEPGVYFENLFINIAGITLVGNDTKTTVIDGSGSGNVIYINADFVNITGFTINNSGSGAFDAGVKLGSNAKNCSISNNTFTNNTDGINFYQCTNITIYNNTFLYSKDYDISIGESHNNTVSYNICNSSCKWGISIHKSCNNSIINNTCSNHGTGGAGIGVSGLNNHFINNTCDNNDVDGIYLVDSKNCTLDNNYCSNNNQGFFIKNVTNITMANNKCYNNNEHGIYVCSSGVHCEIIHNNCSNNLGGGITIGPQSENDLIKDNTVNHNNWSAVHVRYADNLTIDNNTCLYNSGSGIDIENSNNNTIQNNNCSHDPLANAYDIQLAISSNNRVYNNNMTSGLFLEGDWGTFTTQEITVNNTSNDKPVYYYKNDHKNNLTVPLNAGQVILGNISFLTIENLSIDGVFTAVLIGYSTNITVRNSTFSNNQVSIFTGHFNRSSIYNNNISDGLIGMLLTISDNNTVEHNTCSDNTWGIYMIGSKDNNITHNLLDHNLNYGITVDEPALPIPVQENSSKNIIHHNDFINNSGGGVQAYDLTCNNSWNYTNGEGNFWSNYESRFPSASNNGIYWDTPYNLNGDMNARDNYPLAKPVRYKLLAIQDMTAGTGTTGDAFTVNCKVTDHINVDKVTLKYWYGTDIGNAVYADMTYNTGTTYWEYTIILPLDSLEPLKYIISASDKNSTKSDLGEASVTIEDNDPPHAVAENDMDISIGSEVIFNATNSYDNIGIVNYTWNFTEVGGDIYLYGEIARYTFNTAGNYEVTLTVKDAAGKAAADIQWVNVSDITPPIFFTAEYDPTVNITESVEITIQIKDDSQVKNSYINYTDVNSNNFNITMTKQSGNDWNITIPPQSDVGTVSFHIAAEDIYSNWNRTGSYKVTIIDNVLPQISMVSYPGKVNVSEDIEIIVEVSDNLAISAVKLNYSDVAGSSHNISMTHAAGPRYTYTIPGQDSAGNIKFFIWVIDVSTNEKISPGYYIEVKKVLEKMEKPEIELVSIPAEMALNWQIPVYVNVYDKLGVDQVYINYTDVNDDITNDTMLSTGSDEYMYNIPAQTNEGNVTLYIAAVNLNGTWNQTGVQSIRIGKDVPPPDIDPPFIVKTVPVDKSVDISVDISVIINFSEPMHVDNVASAISIEPGIEFTLAWNENKTSLRIEFKEDLQEGELYTITISVNATDQAENHLTENFIFTFKTEPSEPVIIEKNYNVVSDKAEIKIKVGFKEEGNATIEDIEENELEDEGIDDEDFGDQYEHIGVFVKIDIPEGEEFDWLYIEVEYDPAKLPPGINPEDLELFYFDEVTDEWVKCEQTGVNTSRHIVWGNITHLTIFAPMAESSGPAAEGDEGGDEVPGINIMVILGLAAVVIIVALVAGMIIIRKRKLPPEEDEEEEDLEEEAMEEDMEEKDMTEEELVEEELVEEEMVEWGEEAEEKEIKEDEPEPVEIDCKKCGRPIEVLYSEDKMVRVRCEECGASGKIKNPHLNKDKEEESIDDEELELTLQSSESDLDDDVDFDDI